MKKYLCIYLDSYLFEEPTLNALIVEADNEDDADTILVNTLLKHTETEEEQEEILEQPFIIKEYQENALIALPEVNGFLHPSQEASL